MKKEENKAVERRLNAKQALIITSLVLVVVLALMFGQGLVVNPVYATVSVDVNPSLELSLNRQLKVVAARAMNEEARQLMTGQKLNGLPWEEAAFRWIEAVRSRYEVKAILLAAVMPEDAVALKSQLMQMEKQMANIHDQGASSPVTEPVQARAIFSNDRAVRNQARDNSLSVGRQMLLNQARFQEQQYNGETICQAPIDELLANLLQNQEADQTRMTIRETQSLTESLGSTVAETNREANRETSQENRQEFGTDEAQTMNRETIREQIRETTCSASASGTPETSRETVREQARETSGSASANGTPETNRETVREQVRETSCTPSASDTPETSRETVRETIRETSGDCSECTSGSGPNATSVDGNPDATSGTSCSSSGPAGTQTQAGGSGNRGN